MRWNRRNQLLFVTGGSGFVGRHLTQSPALGQWEVVAPSSATVDITSPERVREQIRQWKPKAVVHLAYRKDDPVNIVGGSRNVARAAAAVGARLIHLSTDVVFGGRPAPYTEDDTPSPITDYGRWKAEAEAAVTDVHPGAVLVRTSLVYGTAYAGHVERDVEAVLAGRSSMAFFTDEVRCPVHADDLATAIVQLAARPDVRGPLHVAGPEALDRAAFARLVARRLGVGAAADRLPTASLAAAGLARPGTVVLDSGRAAALGIRCRAASDVLRG